MSDELRNKVKEAIKAQMERSAGNVAAIPEPEVAPVEKKEKPVLKNGQRWFTEVVGCKEKDLPSDVEDFPVTVFQPEEWPEVVRSFIPPVDEAYELQLDQAAAVAFALEHGEKVLITGPTGSGKSSLVRQLCALLGRPILRVNMTADMESATLFGALVVENSATVWKDGPVTEAVRHGICIAIDEWDVTPPEILFGLQWLFEHNGRLYLKEMPGDSKDKFIAPHQEFRLVCLGNTIGQGDETGKFAGVNVQNSATIDRFETTVHLGYLDQRHEARVIGKQVPGLTEDFTRRMIQLAKLVRTSYEQNNINLTMSPRTLVNWGRKTLQFGGQQERALRLAFGNKLRDSDLRLLDEMYFKVFGKKLRAS